MKEINSYQQYIYLLVCLIIWKKYYRYKVEGVNRSVEHMRSEWTPPEVGLLHWDGKQMSTLDGGGEEERLPVLLSGVGGTKLLGAPALPPRENQPMGDLIAEAAVGCAERWNCTSSVVGMVFDTTASNTGN